MNATLKHSILPSFHLDGRRALVTGAGRGIGFGAATALAEAGAHVVLAARTPAEIEAGAAELRDAGWSASPMRLDGLEVETLD